LEDFTEIIQRICPEADTTYYYKKIGSYAKAENLKKNWENYITLWLESDKEKGKLKTLRKPKNNESAPEIHESPEQSMIRSVLEKSVSIPLITLFTAKKCGKIKKLSYERLGKLPPLKKPKTS
jgi:hypothetical protein